MNKLLIVVDMQNDFVGGALGTAEAQAIVPRVAEKIAGFPGRVIFTKDTHDKGYLSTQEGRYLPVEHCVKGTAGHDLCDVISAAKAEDAAVYEKGAFGSITLADDLRRAYEREPIDEIELCGVCTDICVVSNALLIKAYLPEVKLTVDSSCCAGVTPRKHEAALEVMRSCQIEVK